MNTPDPITPPEPADITPTAPAPKNLSPSDIADQSLASRAQRAERQAAQLETRLAQLTDQLEHARAAITDGEKSHRLDLALSAAGAVDLDTARLLVARVTTETPDAEPADILAQLVREKPFLFRPSAPAHSSMAPAFDDHHALTSAARRAAATGDRAALLDYLRARRTA